MIPWTGPADHVPARARINTIDSGDSRVYIQRMSENINSAFEHLAYQWSSLGNLKQRQDVLTSERATLLQKNEQVRARVEAMIGRLKAMEQGS